MLNFTKELFEGKVYSFMASPTLSTVSPENLPVGDNIFKKKCDIL